MSPASAVTAESLPLTGIRVIEFSHMVMGPSCGMILADLGAEVIKVEPRGRGDKTRYLPGSGSGLFPAFNRNKKSVQLDIAEARDRETALSLIESADVLLENFRVGKMESMGYGYEELSARNPGLVYCSLKGFLPGPYGRRAALDEVVQMLGGLAYMTGPPGQPLRAGASVNDIMGGMFGVIGVLSALRLRERTGRGQVVNSALFENNAFLVGTHMAQAQLTDEPLRPMPTRMATWAVYDIFRDRHGSQIFVAAVSDGQWRDLCEEFGLDDLLADPDLDDNQGRVDQRDRIHRTLQSALSALDLDAIEAKCTRRGLPVARVNTPADLTADEHLVVSGALASTGLPPPSEAEDGPRIDLPLLPLTLDGRRLGLRSDVPAPGEHNAELRDHLGVDRPDGPDTTATDNPEEF
ncbi:crotonobetainyl-CoA:carnitine CoA-transferase CaiB-like acyl-CoA transferase [Brevibacterium sanguinis]|uniref:Crotonobetainyl-CoA:carnitine CoA-transferase CaiB-like acyl-CoA transferase n=2 Tax=Brevibacterium TaxID=1696 RepID=A0A366IHG3_9MICO|nr:MULTISPECIES: CaiB/BaiF CoA-transferase family protein [Brevibacterium]RBP64993.1 crotonobetainyl-CoA:carnitine CoA-transferase CaiB-like acyl-CoA transferase [Brevibacterium sanguinis]RBP71256.1 crotonobetainyl-CoA:carnitine CoA-transferase CaiB-like acyl-CoA transferase [Brevibacterium celere]